MSAAASPSSTLKLQTNVVETIALKFADGLPVSSQFSGDQIMYSLVDGRKLYLPPIVESKIAQLQLHPGEYFNLCKREVTHGNRRGVEYQVERVAPAGIRAVSTREAPQRWEDEPQPTTPTVTRSAPAAAAPAVPAVFAAHSLTTCYESAVDVALGAVEYAKTRGLLLSPTFEDIRMMAATLFINESRGGGR